MLPTRPAYIIELVFWAWVGWVWVHWFKRGNDPAIPSWRRIVILCGFSLATFSVLLDVFMSVHAMLTGGFPFYHPVELFCIRAGSLASLLGILAAFIGKGNLRLPIFAACGITLFVWFADAMAQ